jgi:hypothetical protein
MRGRIGHQLHVPVAHRAHRGECNGVRVTKLPQHDDHTAAVQQHPMLHNSHTVQVCVTPHYIPWVFRQQSMSWRLAPLL